MKILILDRDSRYVERLEHYLNQYASEMQILGFDSRDKMRIYMEQKDFDVVLCGESEGFSNLDELDLPVSHVPFAWLSKRNEIIGGQCTIFKYQSIPQIYEQLCNLYESVYQSKVNRKSHGTNAQEQQKETAVITFFPAHGGAGSSVMAISCAQKFSQTDRVLYLNLEQFGCDSYFVSENTATFSDVIAVMKGKYTKKGLKNSLESVCCNDSKLNSDKLFFIKGCKNALDVSQVKGTEITEILTCLREMKQYDYIIIDASMVVGELTAALIQSSDKLVFTTDASNEGSQKLKKVQRYVQLMERESQNKAHQFLIYNKYYADTFLAEYTQGMVVVGTFGRYRLKENQQITRQTIVRNICRTPQLFEKLQ